MCPDGAMRDHLCTDACGANINRQWVTVQPDYVAPSLEHSLKV